MGANCEFWMKVVIGMKLCSGRDFKLGWVSCFK